MALVRGLAALVALELLLHTAATPISGSTKIERSSVSERTVVRPSERRVLFGDDSTCSTFCGAGRPCTAPCQQAGCSNCGGGGGGGGGSNRGNGGSSSSNSGGSTSDGGSSGGSPRGGSSASQCPDDSSSQCSSNCACPSGQNRMSYNKNTCFTCKSGGGSTSVPQCPDDRGSNCDNQCTCPSNQQKMTYSVKNQDCHTCKAGGSSSSSSSGPPPSPPAPTVPPTPWPWQKNGAASTAAAAQKYCSAIGETKCYNTPDCGYCIAENYDSGCVPGDATGPWSPIVAGGSTVSDCNREWQAGVFRPPGSMCVTVVSSTDIRCYQDCMGGGGQQQFIVPNQATCMQYDTAYKKTPTPAKTRQGVQQHVTGHLLKSAVLNMHVQLLREAGHTDLANQAEQSGTFQFYHPSGASAQHDDATTALLQKGITSLEDKGLHYVEDAACGATMVIGPEGPAFCELVFNSPVGTWINNKIENIPMVKQATHWMASTCANLLPSGLRSAADDVIDVYNTAKKVANVANAVEHPVTTLENACKSVGSKIADSVFGWL